MKVTKQTREEYTKNLPNLRREMEKNNIVNVIIIESEKAIAMAYEFLGGWLNLSYGSRSLLERYKKERKGK